MRHCIVKVEYSISLCSCRSGNKNSGGVKGYSTNEKSEYIEKKGAIMNTGRWTAAGLFGLFCVVVMAGCRSQTIAVLNLDDTVEAFACRASAGAKRAGANIKSATLEIHAVTAYDAEAGAALPVAVPVTGKLGASISESTKLTLELDVAGVDCATKRARVRAYNMNLQTLVITEQKSED